MAYGPIQVSEMKISEMKIGLWANPRKILGSKLKRLRRFQEDNLTEY
jgi:hypothetical protein